MTRTLVFEDESVRRFELRDDDGELLGYDEEGKYPPEESCPTCGRPY